MKRVLGLLVAVSLLSAGSILAAGPDIPNLVGTWSVKSEGAMVLKGDKAGAKTHRTPGVSTLEADFVVTKQDGRVLSGFIKSKKATEDFLAVVGHDNKSLYFVDTDGYLDGRIVDADTIETVYRHTTDKEVIIAIGSLKRKK